MKVPEFSSPGPGRGWFTSSYSNGAGGECVECATSNGHTFVRDSKHSDGPVISVTPDAWRHFTSALRRSDLSQHA
ncbi:DUF397 domain-containing protein [Streptomyces sp. GXMU-J15]|uniref:DUF397 domain-containing protein n=1 Tax=Streptomyces fuscus TaxID=3048495 RepID=A0ABT7J477_9ACTN|nr:MULTISPECIES: DUF397 domain-containing protein [Streptomyces]MDL2079665.1 DUF397 domain-containing protein [Streptomyces fuscus]SBT91190.1 protein of unknown function [Streptomyces sp. DI166]